MGGLVLVLEEPSGFFGLHLPAWPSDSCSGVSAGGFGGSEEKKREGSSSGHVRVFFVPHCPAKQRIKPLSLIFLWKMGVE